MSRKKLRWTRFLLAFPALLAGCASGEPQNPQEAEPSVDSAEVVCDTLQEINDLWFGTLEQGASPESTVDALRGLSGRLAAEVITWSGPDEALLRTAAEQVSRDLSVINAFSANAPTTVEDSDQFIATLDEFPINLEAALSLCSQQGAAEPTELRSAGGETPLSFELTQSVTAEALTDSMTNLGQIHPLRTGGLLVVDRPYSLQPLSYESLYLRYFDGSEMQEVRTREYDGLNDFSSISADGQVFSSSLETGGCVLVDVDSGAELAKFGTRNDKKLNCKSAFSPSGDRFFFIDKDPEDSGAEVLLRTVDTATLTELQPMDGGPNPWDIFLFGDYLFLPQSAGEFGVFDGLRVVDFTTGELVREIPVENAFYDMVSNPNSSVVYFATHGTAQVWALDKQTLELKEIAQLSHGAMELALSPDGKLLAMSHNEPFEENDPVLGVVSILDTVTGEVVQEIEVPDTYTGSWVTFLSDERLIARGNEQNFYVYDQLPSS